MILHEAYAITDNILNDIALIKSKDAAPVNCELILSSNLKILEYSS